MYGRTLKVHGQYLARGMALPRKAQADGNGAPQQLSGTLGGVEVVAEVAAELGLAQGTELVVTLMHGEDGDYRPLGTLCRVSGGHPVEAGEVLGRFVIPTDAGELVKAVVSTTDAAASGCLDIYPHYLAR
ncbi:hypothetical protein GGQ74_002201 [Desulfobaculum xiamenense]|uniref:Uncharacterized protein n=1 Tax=Desulfobaculum xiamenense TaxID=995050 RepID=A0A846QJZ4_9BACT|nr:hypothetical protein [Desulfobaculum xiamenense]NJB68528.1 hypothetical protein [Desulfobaculum xiamenense]